MRSSSRPSGFPPFLGSAEKHETTLLGILTRSNSDYTLPLFGLKSIESATYSPACVVPDIRFHFSNGFEFEERPLVRGC